MLFNRILGVSAAAMAASSLMHGAYAQEATRSYDIPGGDLATALRQFAEQSDTNVLFDPDLVRAERTEGLKGDYSQVNALSVLLKGTRLVSRLQNGTVIVALDSARSAPGPEGRGPSSPFEGQADRVIVTGTSLRGIAQDSSPVLVYNRADIEASGAATTEQFMRLLPQNFGGGSSELAPSGLPGDSNSTFNNTFGSGANLRGLGSGATLTLLNGRRLAPSSRIGDFVDLSMIPVSALERVDIMTDGASSIYGGDAVAGVVNFVLRDDFKGAETSVRYGSVTSGDMSEVRVNQTLGGSWDSGNLMATYEYAFRDNLVLSDRPEIPVPTLTGGQPIVDTGLFDLSPKRKRHSAIVSGKQELGSRLRISGDIAYSDKSVTSATIYAGPTSSLQVYRAGSELLSVGLGAEYDLAPRWALSLDLNNSQIRSDDAYQLGSASGVSTGGRETRADVRSADLLLNGEWFAAPGGDVSVAVGGHWRRETFANANIGSANPDRADERDVSALYAEVLVPLFGRSNARPGLRRLELNLSARMDDYSDFGSTTNPKVGVLWSPGDGLNLRGTYSTSFTPPPLGRTGDQGRSGTVAPFSYILGAFGLSAPDPSLVSVDFLQAGGTAADLGPETSRTYTFGWDFERQTGPHGWSIGSSYYNIAFEGRLSATPMPQNQLAALAPIIAFNDPQALPAGTVIFFPTPQDVAAYVATFNRPVSFFAGAVNLDNVGIINNASIVRNLSSTRTSGIDLIVDYTFDTGEGVISAGLNVNHILDFTQQAAATSAVVSTLDTLQNPVDLNIRGSVGFSRGGFAGNLFLNHVDAYATDNTASATRVDSWTTADLSLRYRFDGEQASFLKGARVGLSVSNLFDEPPPATPSYGTVRLAGYDPTNASPVMRLVTFELAKTF